MNIKTSLSHRNTEPENSTLYVVGTPIGNLNDISFRALDVLKRVSYIACEDTRQTYKIMNKFNIKNNLISFNNHNSYKKIPILINDLKSGMSIALVSDAGMPAICDPGEDLINIAKINGLDTICIPGPSAALTALVSSGLSSSKFIFEGFLPKKNIEREKILKEISQNEKTTIIFESPHRLHRLLNELRNHCGGEREIHICRELTKKFEEHLCNNLDNVINNLSEKNIIGEITIVIKGLNKDENIQIDEANLRDELCDLIDAGLSLTSASKYLARKYNLKKKLIYNLY